MWRRTSPRVANWRDHGRSNTRIPSLGSGTSLGESKTSGGLRPLVAMMHAAESRMVDDLGIATRLRGGRSHRRRALAQPEVRPVVVVVPDKLGEKSVQVPLVEDDHVVEQVSPHGRDPAFRHTVGRSCRGHPITPIRIIVSESRIGSTRCSGASTIS